MGTKPHPPNNLKKLRVHKGWTQAQVSEKFGLSESGYIKVEDSERGIKGDRLKLAAEIFGVRQQDIFDPSYDPARPADEELVVPSNRAFSYKPVIGELEAGVFRDAELFEDEVDEMISAPPNTRFPWARQRVWRVKGDSMNEAKPKPINDGDYIVGIVYEDIEEAVTLVSGLNAVVKRTQDNWQTFERTVKEFAMFDDHVELIPRSSNTKHKTIIVARDLTADDGTIVEIEALVQYVIDSHESLF